SIALAAFNSDLRENGAAADLTGLGDDRILICTPEGIKCINRADLQKTHPESDTEIGLRCALCILPTFGTTVGNILLTSEFTPVPLVMEIGQYAPARDIRCANMFHIRGAFSRAPPHLT